MKLILFIYLITYCLCVGNFGPSPTRVHHEINKVESFRQLNFLQTKDVDYHIQHILRRQLNMKQEDYEIIDKVYNPNSNMYHIYAKKKLNGKVISNADIHLNLDSLYNVVSLSETKFDNTIVGLEVEYLDQDKLMGILNYFFNFIDYTTITLNLINFNQIKIDDKIYDIKIENNYIINNNNQIQLVYELDINLMQDWYKASISINNNNNYELISLINYNNKASYKVYELGTNDPSKGQRKMLFNPYNKLASPLGWHNDGTKNYTTSKGNNVYVYYDNKNHNLNNQYEIDGGNQLIFDYPLNLNGSPEYYINASITNLFYMCNILHDLYYLYGFDESSGNFQNNNFNKGGLDKDGLIAYAQSSEDFNNADFLTPPDGSNPRMRMYLWDETIPNRDGALEQDIIIHEYTHGLSIRLTGGPSNSGCLGWGEAGGMGEGWGDVLATILSMNINNTRYKNYYMGYYANNNKGIRKYPYSTDLNINPSTYRIMDKTEYWPVHLKGEVWAVMVLEVYWNLIDEYKFNENWYDINNSLNYGNTLMLRLILDTLKLQPCRPNFIDTRDSMLLAAKNLKKHDTKLLCLIWKGFAKRGLGKDAKLIGSAPWGGGQRVDSFELPDECK